MDDPNRIETDPVLPTAMNDDRERVVVGVDQSASSHQALRWAQAYGRSVGAAVTAVMAWDYLGQPHLTEDARFDPEYSAASAQAVVDALVATALGEGHDVTCTAVLDKAGRALVEASRSAALVVVGARGMGGFRGLLLGSVSRHVLHHAHCPVAVIRGDDADPADPAGPVIVGVDGSESSLRALQWAADLPATVRRTLVVAHAWQIPIDPMTGTLGFISIRDQLEEAADGTLRQALAHAGLDAAQGDVDARAIEGPAAAELLALADERNASLVVVGARGGGRLAAALLGSVSDQVAQHASCPVVVVP